MTGELAGRTALVTGASRGIGAAIAERFAAEGADLVIAARTAVQHPRLPGSLRETAERIAALGRRAVVVEADLQHEADRARLADEALAAFGAIDILVNDAAASFYLPFLEISRRRWDVAFEINVRAPFELAQHLLPAMRAQHRGWILNVSSKTAQLPPGPPFDDFQRHGGPLLYGMTKAALDRFSAGLAAELESDGIPVNSLSPVGAVMTPGVEALGVVPEAWRESAEPVEAMAEAALALCLPGAPTGRIAYSLPLLEELGRPLHTLDGRTLLDDLPESPAHPRRDRDP